jgi:hypothetical protein
MSDGAEPEVRILDGNVPVGIGDDVAVLVRVADTSAGPVARLSLRTAEAGPSSARVAVGDVLTIGGAVWQVTEVRPSSGSSDKPFGRGSDRVVMTAIEGGNTG